MAIAFDTDPVKVAGFSLPASKVKAITHLATIRGHGNKSRIVDEALEAYFREEYGKKWKVALFADPGEDDDDEDVA